MDRLQVHINSDTYDNKTQAVSKGKPLKGFLRPCRQFGRNAAAVVKTNAAQNKDAGAAANCVADRPILTIPRRDTQTIINIDIEDSSDLPTLLPPPELSVNKRMLIAKIVDSKPTYGGHRLAIKYSCLRDGVSNVSLTVHIGGEYKSVDIAWRKRCAGPRIHSGTAFTAPQVMSLVFFLVTVPGVMVFVVLYRRHSEASSATDFAAELGFGDTKEMEVAKLVGKVETGDDGIKKEGEDGVAHHF